MTAEPERSRPAANGPAVESLHTNTASVRATADYFALLAACSGPDDPLFRAAGLLGDGWGHALRAEWERGYREGDVAGDARGYRRAETEMEESWSAVASKVRALLAALPPEELAKARAADFAPCRADCGKCSKCIAASHYAARGGRLYLGADAEAQLAETNGGPA